MPFPPVTSVPESGYRVIPIQPRDCVPDSFGPHHDSVTGLNRDGIFRSQPSLSGNWDISRAASGFTQDIPASVIPSRVRNDAHWALRLAAKSFAEGASTGDGNQMRFVQAINDKTIPEESLPPDLKIVAIANTLLNNIIGGRVTMLRTALAIVRERIENEPEFNSLSNEDKQPWFIAFDQANIRLMNAQIDLGIAHLHGTIEPAIPRMGMKYLLSVGTSQARCLAAESFAQGLHGNIVDEAVEKNFVHVLADTRYSLKQRLGRLLVPLRDNILAGKTKISLGGIDDIYLWMKTHPEVQSLPTNTKDVLMEMLKKIQVQSRTAAPSKSDDSGTAETGFMIENRLQLRREVDTFIKDGKFEDARMALAKIGTSDSQNDIGELHLREGNINEASHRFLHAGTAKAYTHLGHLHMHKIIRDPSDKMAHHYFQESDTDRAQISRAIMHLSGRAPNSNPELGMCLLSDVVSSEARMIEKSFKEVSQAANSSLSEADFYEMLKANRKLLEDNLYITD
jgi:hypothetical protein